MPRFKRSITIFASLALTVVTQAATITPIQPSPGEPDLVELLDGVYGSGNYFRIDDDADQTWAAGQITVTAISTYSAAVENIGYCHVCDGSDDVLADQLISTDGVFSTPLTFSSAFILAIGSEYTWFNLAQFHPYVGKLYSDPALNPLGADHMVTFGLFGQPDTYILAFEDWLFTADPASDADYQDLILQVTYVSAPPSSTVPEPGAWVTLASGLAALLYIRRKRLGS